MRSKPSPFARTPDPSPPHHNPTTYTMALRPETEVQDVLKRLREVRDKVPARTHFGDDNHEAIDAAIAVLDEKLDEDDVYGRFEPGDDDDINADEGRSDHSLENARAAAAWLHCEDDDDPATGWEELVAARDKGD